MERNTIKDNRLYFGRHEFVGLMKVLIRTYKFRSKGKDPEAIVLPNVKEVDGIKIEIEEIAEQARPEEVIEPTDSGPSDTDGGGHSLTVRLSDLPEEE